jgi:hypothetical protein
MCSPHNSRPGARQYPTGKIISITRQSLVTELLAELLAELSTVLLVTKSENL